MKTVTLVYKFLQTGSSSCGPSLSVKSCSCSTRHSHADYQYQTVPFHPTLQVKHCGHSLAFDVPKIWNDLHVRRGTSIATEEKAPNVFAKAYLPWHYSIDTVYVLSNVVPIPYLPQPIKAGVVVPCAI